VVADALSRLNSKEIESKINDNKEIILCITNNLYLNTNKYSGINKNFENNFNKNFENNFNKNSENNFNKNFENNFNKNS